MINTVSKINLSKIGWEGVNLNLDNVFKYTVFFRVPLSEFFCSPFNIPIFLTVLGMVTCHNT